MVRILTCHHFGGQKICKCDEALQLTVADDFIVLALEHQVSVYNSEFPTDDYAHLGRSGFTTGATRDGGDIGSSPIYFDPGSSSAALSISEADPLQKPVLQQQTSPFSQSKNMGKTKSSSAFSTSIPPETQIRFSHSFPTVDLIESISYNRRGNYLLCLEKRERSDPSSQGGGQASNNLSSSEPSQKNQNSSKNVTTVSRSIRIYFNWDNVTDENPKPMKARIAGLVSPTGGEPDDDVLCMVEIPGRPAPNTAGQTPMTVPNVLAVSSCNILGHLASLTDANTVNIYSYRLKDHGKGRGRTSNSQYADFDFSYTIEIFFSLSPARCRINFLADIIAVSSANQLSVFRLSKPSRNRTRSISNESGTSGGSGGTNSVYGGKKSASIGSGSGGLFLNFTENSSAQPQNQNQQQQPLSMSATTSFKNKIVHAAVNLLGDGVLSKDSGNCEKVIFDPKNESVKVHMNLISRANQKRSLRDTSPGIYEEFQEEIGTGMKSRLIYTVAGPALIVEDLLRVFISPEGNNHAPGIVQVELYSLKVRDDLGGVACILGTSSQAFVYHIPVRREANVCRVVTYPLTAPLVSFAFDSLFFHALTETGLETYTSRSLYHPMKEFEGFQRYRNDCPFQDETPSLVGIRPFMGVRYMAANELMLCLLASPANQWGSASSASPEENQWTIYALQLPTIDMLYEDISKAALQPKTTNPETHTTLTSELHLILRAYINMNPEMEINCRNKYRQTCKWIGIDFCKRGSALFDELKNSKEDQLDSNTRYEKELLADDFLDKGVTYLNMAGMDLKSIFEEDPNVFIKDKKMTGGITRYINVMIPSSGIVTTNTGNTHEGPLSTGSALSPKLAAAVTEFLVAHSPESLVTLVINVPILRESNSAKLLQILKKMAEASGYRREEAIALLLTLITISGCDQVTRGQVKDILSKCNSNAGKETSSSSNKKDGDLDYLFDLLWLLDLKNINEPKITDLTVCLSASGSTIPLNVLYRSLSNSEVTIGQLMRAFSQGINLNAELEVQQALTRTLTNILEYYFLDKLRVYNSSLAQQQRFAFKSTPMGNTFETKTNFENNILNNAMSNSSPLQSHKILPSFNQHLSDDERHAVTTLVRSYISHVTLKPIVLRTRKNSGGQATVGAATAAKTDLPPKMAAAALGKKGHEKSASFAQGQQESSYSGRRSVSPELAPGPISATVAPTPASAQPQASPLKLALVAPANKNVLIESKLTPFGKVPNFLIHIIKEMNASVANASAEIGGGPVTSGVTQPQINIAATSFSSSFQLLSMLPTANDETKEYFIKLSSLLASPMGHTPGVREIVVNFLETKGQGCPGTTLHVCLQLLAESSEKAVSFLIAKYPLALMYYAKEMFGRSTAKWKILVLKLKEKIYSNSDDVEMFSTIIESVYLYLANTLSPTELEEVLDKGEENSKFFKACRRTELANSYSNMVIQMSNEYLQ